MESVKVRQLLHILRADTAKLTDSIKKFPPNHPVRIKIGLLLVHLQEILNKPQNPLEISARKLIELKEDIQNKQSLVKEQLDQLKSGRVIDLKEFKGLKAILTQLVTIESTLKGELNQRGISAEAKAIPTRLEQKNNPMPAQARERLSISIAESKLRPSSLKTEFTASIEQIIAEIGRKELFRSPVKFAAARSSHAFEILARLVTSTVARDLGKEITSRVERAGELTDIEISKAVAQINEQAPKLGAAEKISVKVEYDENNHSIGIEIMGETKEAEATKSAAEIISSNPKETVRELIKVAADQITSYPEAKTEILKSVSQIASQSFTPPAPSMPSSNPITAKISEAQVKEIVKMLIDELQSASAPVPEPNAPVSHSQAKADVIYKVLAEIPEIALPVLLDREIEKEIIKPLVMEVAKTEKGAAYVIKAFSQKTPASPEHRAMPSLSRQSRGVEGLVSSEIGQQVVIETAKSLIGKAISAKTEVKANTPITAKDKFQQAQIISRLVVSANAAKLAPAQLNFDTARAFISFIAEIQQCFDPIAVKNIRRANRPSAKNANLTVYNRGKTQPNPTQRIVQKAIREGNVTERAQALREVLRTAKDHNFIIPKMIVENFYAGLAGINPMPAKVNAMSLLPLPLESASASSLKRAVAALEAQAAMAVRGRDHIVWGKVFTLSAQAFLYGIIMRLVKGRIGRVDEIIKALKKKYRLALVVKRIKEGDIETAAELIANEVLEFEIKNLDEVLAA